MARTSRLTAEAKARPRQPKLSKQPRPQPKHPKKSKQPKQSKQSLHSEKPKRSKKTPKLRASITPGTILILLAGRFRGKRVVFLKQLESGLLLITGPFKINGVPLRRVNQAYVIATSTKVEIDSSITDKFTDAYFAKDPAKKQSAEEEFFENGKPKPKEPIPEAKAVDQKELDNVVVAAVNKQELLSKYLKSSWGLGKGEFPHKLVF
ncbi:ribosomal protein L6e-domain-containing protein [Cantharellus anzutake]|uniref:ribosomal protein L6e-domain-containing protein n=1 Tax=Cantharellus anzutake TaxID=1750568 RepID=UPI00190386B0|nr:ribosomal protein L6e-domain-containing protein [Cantharellus anzutake]KAF8335025.1 ribosomal protein L6e-domain-containing protein [Cantharellus anzutake]